MLPKAQRGPSSLGLDQDLLSVKSHGDGVMVIVLVSRASCMHLLRLNSTVWRLARHADSLAL